MKYEGPKSNQSKYMSDVKVFVDKQTDNGQTKNYIPQMYQCRCIKIQLVSLLWLLLPEFLSKQDDMSSLNAEITLPQKKMQNTLRSC